MRSLRLRHWILVGVLAYLLAGTAYAAASAWKDRHDQGFDEGGAEAISWIFNILFWPVLLAADGHHKVGVFEPDTSAREAPPLDG